MLNGKSVLITGGTGSFGRKCTEVILRDYRPKRVVIFSRDELKQYEMAQAFSGGDHSCLRFFLGTVRDRDRLITAFKNIDYVIHAAALKQVPAAEYNPTECIATNIMGAENLIMAAAATGVKKVIALSTDKAVSPANLYGATKLCSDKLFVAANAYTARASIFSVVRYGNVMGSRGSVIPLFRSLKESGEPLPITDKRMTRFWITLEQAVKMVLKSLEISAGGEILVPKIPSMRLTDLAEAIAPGHPLKEIGIRPGEKIHECMFTTDDARHTVDIGDYYLIKPETFPYNGLDGERIPEDFAYSSDSNTWWLGVEELRHILSAGA